ncbi:MAG: hypothetical protein RMK29_21400 [Myxococcales bacterium]|nr:hypothetical protein [Myxococcota bacterium]MDW8284268.1 hypothetical protein [Myxococcales bacterium]
MEPRTDAARTQLDAALAEAQRRYAGDPERADLIARTRRFKSSWIELAEALSDCRQRERFRAWGFRTFEDYYRRELRLKTHTVDKLIGSFAFLRHAAPEVLRRDGVNQAIPGFEAVDFLRRAEEARLSGQADEDTVAEVRRAVLEDNMSLPRVSRLFKETLFPTDANEDQRRRQREVYRTAQRLVDLLEGLGDSLPPPLLHQVQDALTALLRALPGEEAEGTKGKARAA